MCQPTLPVFVQILLETEEDLVEFAVDIFRSYIEISVVTFGHLDDDLVDVGNRVDDDAVFGRVEGGHRHRLHTAVGGLN